MALQERSFRGAGLAGRNTIFPSCCWLGARMGWLGLQDPSWITRRSQGRQPCAEEGGAHSAASEPLRLLRSPGAWRSATRCSVLQRGTRFYLDEALSSQCAWWSSNTGTPSSLSEMLNLRAHPRPPESESVLKQDSCEHGGLRSFDLHMPPPPSSSSSSSLQFAAESNSCRERR